MIEQLREEGIELIWDNIKPRVADRMFDEFKSLYNANKEHLNFKALIETGQYTPVLDELEGHQQAVSASLGYRRYCSEILLNSTRFFSIKNSKDEICAHRHDSPEAQKQYDQRFGLALRK